VKSILSMLFKSVVLLLVIGNSAWANEIDAEAGTSAVVLLIGIALLITEVKRQPNRRSSVVDTSRGADR
jgi:hypothetical protein